MGLFLSPIDKSISGSLSLRQSNTESVRYGWQNRKTPWCRMTSLAKIKSNSSVIPDDTTLRLKWQLQAGMAQDKNVNEVKGAKNPDWGGFRAGYDEIYNSDTNRPMPGITNVTVSNKGSMGSVRESTISFSCFTLEDLEKLEILYMNPGISILLEWGWSLTIDNKIIDSDYNLSKLPPMPDRDMAVKISEKVKQSGGHYDAMQGVCTNFTWSFRKDGGFDCTTTIISVASMFLEMDIHSTSKNINRKSVKMSSEVAEEDENIPIDNIVATIANTIDSINNNNAGNLYANISLDNSEDVLCGTKLQITASDYEDGEFHNISKDKDIHYFVTWEFIEQIIINNNLSLLIDNDNTDSTNNTDNPYYQQQLRESGQFQTLGNQVTTQTTGIVEPVIDKTKLIPIMNSNETRINYKLGILSGDPLKCILPTDNIHYVIDVIPTELKKTPVENKFYLKDILVNLRFILDTYKTANTLNDLVLNMAKGISESCGGLWDFSLMIDEEKPTEMKVVDNGTIDADRSKLDPFVFKVYNKDCILSEVSLSTEVSNRMKTHIMLGTNRKENKMSGTNTNISREPIAEYNFYGNDVVNMGAPKLKTIPASKYDYSSENKDIVNNKIYTAQDYLNDVLKFSQKMYDVSIFSQAGVTPEKIQTLKTALNRYVTNVIRSKGDNTKVDNDKNLVLFPLKLSFTLDGISGLYFGNVISIDYMPKRYKEKTYFQITNVSHTISPGTWTTSVETQMRTDIDDVNLHDNNNQTNQPKFVANIKIEKKNEVIQDNVLEVVPVESTQNNKMISGNFKVNGIPFAQWYNKTIVPLNPSLYYRIDETNFNTLIGKNLQNLTGKSEITLSEFAGHCAIILNETAGTFKPTRELGGQSYMFNAIGKSSYNQSPNRLAGDQLKSWGIISSVYDVSIWNGTTYPKDALQEVITAAEKCDFYRFRGYGFNQLTWRTNFINCLQPHIPNLIDSYSVSDFETLINDYRIAALTFQSYITISQNSKYAISELVKGNFSPYGMLVSGGWQWYVTNKFLPRCNAIYAGIRNAKIEPYIK